jgi:hypothetical protein
LEDGDNPFPTGDDAMRPLASAVLLASIALSGCVAPVGPVEVTRFHLPDTTPLGQGAIRVEAGPGADGTSIEFRTYAAAVARELTRLGYTEAAPGAPAGSQIAVLTLDRRTLVPARRGSPVSVGLGGGTGSYGSGVGVGLGINLSGPPPEMVQTELAVTIRERGTGRSLWEGRANFAVKSSSPLAQTPLGAAKMAQALFKDFPGRSGETIWVE